jgi:hypothetical protein
MWYVCRKGKNKNWEKEMTHINRIMQLMLTGLCFIISGCVSAAMMLTPPNVPLAPEQADAAAKRFQSQPGKASIYVMQEYIFTGQVTPSQVSLDGKDQGKLSPGTYFLFMVPPGKHEVSSKGEASRGTETIYAVDGGIYYLEIRPKPGIKAPPANIFRIDQQRGRHLVLEGKRAEIKTSD